MRFVSKLNFKQKVELSEMMRLSPNFKVRQRAHAILLSDKQYKIDDISAIFDVDRDTVSAWLGRWEKSGFDGLEDAPRSGRPRKSVSSSPRRQSSIEA